MPRFWRHPEHPHIHPDPAVNYSIRIKDRLLEDTYLDTLLVLLLSSIQDCGSPPMKVLIRVSINSGWHIQEWSLKGITARHPIYIKAHIRQKVYLPSSHKRGKILRYVRKRRTIGLKVDGAQSINEQLQLYKWHNKNIKWNKFESMEIINEKLNRRMNGIVRGCKRSKAGVAGW